MAFQCMQLSRLHEIQIANGTVLESVRLPELDLVCSRKVLEQMPFDCRSQTWNTVQPLQQGKLVSIRGFCIAQLRRSYTQLSTNRLGLG